VVILAAIIDSNRISSAIAQRLAFSQIQP